MDNKVVQAAKELSIHTIRRAGSLATERFDRFAVVQAKDKFGDVVTEVDYMTEELIIREIQSVFPTHHIHSEEAGSIGPESEWLWLIDPLDGTNNFAIGLAIYTISITLLFKGEPVLGVIYEPTTDRLFVAASGEGAYCNNQKISMKSNANLSKGNIGWIQGHIVQNDHQAVKLRQYIDVNCKRMMRLWAPTLQWCMLAKVDIDGIVLYNSEGDDLYSGLLMVKEAGGIVIDFNGSPFTSMNNEPYLIACHPDHEKELLEIVRNGLSGISPTRKEIWT